MNILVTGSTGFIGRELCMQLAGRGHTVHALCRSLKHPLLPEHRLIKPYQGNILDKESLLTAMLTCQQVYHTAALAKMWTKNQADFYDINVTGTKNVMELCLKLGISKVVHTSTCGVLGPTLNIPLTEDDPRIAGFPIQYERTKYLAELVVRSYAKQGLPAVIVNPSRVYGCGPITGSNTVGRMVNAYLKGRWRINPGNGKQVSNYAYLDDVVNGHIAAMEKGITGNRYILGGEDISFDHFFRTLKKVSGLDYRLFNVPQKLIKAYSIAESFKTTLTGIPPFLLPEFADRLKYNQVYSSEKARQQLGYTITPFINGLTKTVNEIKTKRHA